MKNSRRKFISGTLLSALALPAAIKANSDEQDKFFYTGNNSLNSGDIIFPEFLKKGDKVAITAPASSTNVTECRYGANFLRENGCEVVYGDTIKNQRNQFRYLSASDESRAEELMSFFADPDIKAIFAGRGGFGTIRILNKLDYDIIKNNPKIIIGFSDITLLLLAIYRKTGLSVFHGPVASMTLNSFTKNYLHQALFNSGHDIIYKNAQFDTITEGNFSGKLVGGNLSMVVSSLGTPYEIDTDDSVIFLEDVSEDGYKIDRMLSHLILAGKFDNVKGIIFGIFKNLNVRRPFYPNRGYSVKEIFEQHIKPLNIPAIYNLPFGHVDTMITMPFGRICEIDQKAKIFTIKINSLS